MIPNKLASKNPHINQSTNVNHTWQNYYETTPGLIILKSLSTPRNYGSKPCCPLIPQAPSNIWFMDVYFTTSGHFMQFQRCSCPKVTKIYQHRSNITKQMVMSRHFLRWSPCCHAIFIHPRVFFAAESPGPPRKLWRPGSLHRRSRRV